MVVEDVIETCGYVRGVEAATHPGLVRGPLPQPLP